MTAEQKAATVLIIDLDSVATGDHVNCCSSTAQA
jgi:hypothetical protein